MNYELNVGMFEDLLLESYGEVVTILEYQGEEEVVRLDTAIADFPYYVISRGAFNQQRTPNLLRVELPIGVPEIEEGAFSKEIEVVRYFNWEMDGFEHQGIWITDPLMDETRRFHVEPLKYYGIIVEKKIERKN